MKNKIDAGMRISFVLLFILCIIALYAFIIFWLKPRLEEKYLAPTTIKVVEISTDGCIKPYVVYTCEFNYHYKLRCGISHITIVDASDKYSIGDEVELVSKNKQ